MSRMVVALYDDLATAQEVVKALVERGIERDHISIVASDVNGEYAKQIAMIQPGEGEHVGPVEGTAFGAAVGALTGVLIALGSLAIPGIGPVIAAGPLAAGLAGAVTGAVAGGATGGIIGSLLGVGVPTHEAHYYAEGVRRGGTLVMVSTVDEWLLRVEGTMNRYHPVDLETRALEWRSQGWKEFSTSSAPYTPEEINRERKQFRATGVHSAVGGRARHYGHPTHV